MDVEEIKATKDIPDVGEVEFSEELLLEHNYIVLYFDNAMDWEVAQEVYGLKNVKSKTSAEKTQKIEKGRVINGKDFQYKIPPTKMTDLLNAKKVNIPIKGV